MSYNPIPPRVWSRVQNPCTFIDPGDQYLSSYIPLTGQTVSQGQADYEMKQLYKGNILQYKGNSARLTKSQKYSQLARCSGPNRTKVFATQSERYTNPNTTGLLRQNSITYPFPNQIVGAPNNISGPFAYDISNPNNCPGLSIQDGGTLVCGTYVNPCSGEIIKQNITSPTICNYASASNVPGCAILCWNTKAQSWFPKQRYFMNNSTDKWPINYKGFVSALTCNNSQPKLVFQGFNNNNIIAKNVDFDTQFTDIFNDIFNLDKDTTDVFKDITYSDIDIIDTELTNTELTNMGLTNTGLTNTGLTNTGLTNTGLTNTGLTNTNFNNTQNTYRDSILYDVKINLKPNSIFKVDSFNIYIDGKFYQNVVNNNSYIHTITNINKSNCVITITSVTNGVESAPSEPIFVNYTPVDTSPLPPVDRYKCELIDVCKKLDSNLSTTSNLINNVYTATTGVSDKLKQFEILIALLQSDPIQNIGQFVNQYVSIMYEDSTEVFPNDSYNGLKVELDKLDVILETNPDLIVTEELTTKNIDMIISKSKNNIIQKTKGLDDSISSPESIAAGKSFLGNYKGIVSLMKSAYDKKIQARSAVLDSLDWKKDSEILNNAIKLKEYVEDLNKTISLFHLDIQPIPVELKRQYAIYHNLYGIPKNLEYDPKLMGPILADLGITVDIGLAAPL